MIDMFPAEALQTAEFVEIIDNLFDSLNEWTTLLKHTGSFTTTVCKIIRFI